MGTPEIHIPSAIIQKWQEIANLLAELARVPAALVMKMEPPEMAVFVSSESEGNPYKRGERVWLDAGFFCEAVMRSRKPLMILNALEDEKWRSSPEVEQGMTYYIGFPISWPDGDVFGTLCVLDRKNSHSGVCYALLSQFRDVIETDLRSLVALDARLAEEALAKQRLEGLVAVRTEELAKANAQLKRDLAERERAEQASRASQKLLEAIIDNSATLIYVKDLDGRYVLINRNCADLLHTTKEAVLGRTDEALFPRGRSEAYRDSDREAIVTGKAVETEEVLKQEDGLHTYLSIKFPLCDDAGVPYAVCGISTDITERKRIEDARTSLLEEEQRARAAAEAAVKMRDDFLSIASHELYTPITGLKLALQSMMREAEKSRSSPPKMLCLAEQQCKRLIKLVENLLSVSRVQTGKLELCFDEVDLLALARDVVDRLEADLSQAGSTVLWHADGPVVGRWDGARLDQVVTNLVMNAVKYGAGKPIEISVTASDRDARLVVEDHGIGIAKDRLPHIFERFERGVPAQHYGGLGLGLFIAREIVAAHGGSIWARSEPGVGSVFTVEIPRWRSCPPRPP